MSDTDDTDLLLLIPPDFFLVHSPDSDDFDESECEVNLSLENGEIQDSIVSDLIFQVNDLESRICMIENLERSATHCSNCNEESFVNQSVNSLTESDILRVETKGKTGELLKDINDSISNHNPELQTSERKLIDSCLENNFENNLVQVLPVVSVSNSETAQSVSVKNNCDSSNLTSDINKRRPRPSSVSYKSDILKEIDLFFDEEKKNASSMTHQPESKNIQSTRPNIGTPRLQLGEPIRIENGHNQGISREEFDDESVALTEVYELVRKMEESQSEAEKKIHSWKTQNLSHESMLRHKDDTFFSIGKSKKVGRSLFRPVSNSQIDNSYLSPVRSSEFSSQNQAILERLQNTDSKTKIKNNPESTHISYLKASRASVLSEESLSPHHDSGRLKLLSPRRMSRSYNLADVVKGNQPVNIQDCTKNRSEPAEVKESSNNNSSFKKHLSNHFNSSSEITQPSHRPINVEFQSLPQESQATSFKINKNKNYDPSFDCLTKGFTKMNGVEEHYNQHPTQSSIESNFKPSSNFSKSVQKKGSSTVVLQEKISANNLLSLSELWNKEPSFYSDDPVKLRQKLEEEKYRRQHCEQQIQALQLRVLEEQEKLAVAIKVDQEKDKALSQITESWRKLNEHWTELEDQRHSLAQQLQEEKTLSKTRNDDVAKKVERWEKEVSQALDLAAGYKEKCEATQEQMELLKANTEEKFNDLTLKLQSLEKEKELTTDENNTLITQLKTFQEKINEAEQLLSKLQTELEKNKKLLSECEAENNVLKDQKGTILCKLKDEKSRSSMLEQQNNTLRQALEEKVKKEKAAEEELRVNHERLEVARTELRALYQGQLETVVKEKLQEFQSQLEAAESQLKAELNLKERQWAEKANEQCRKLQEKHKLDKQRLEDSFREEVRKWRVKLSEIERQKAMIESRLQDETNSRADIAQRLHSVMETQWREALNIISNPIQNIHEVEKEGSNDRWPSSQQNAEKMRGAGDVRVSSSSSTLNVAQAEEAPFCKDGLITYRASQPAHDQQQLKRYIQMLLERGPGISSFQSDTFQESLDQSLIAESSFVDNKLFHVMDDVKKVSEQNQRSGQSNKPPWK